MTKDETRIALEEGSTYIYVGSSWCFIGRSMSCNEGCCDDSFKSVEEALDTIELFCGGDWSKVVGEAI